MRCKQHPREQGSVGVCPSCLRERLLALIADQAREAQSDEDYRKSDAHQPPLLFPRSVSPYVCRRSGENWRQERHLFYSTPQVGPTFSKKKKSSRFSLISTLLGSRSDENVNDSKVYRSTSSPSPSTWLKSLFPHRRKKKSRLFSLEEEIPSSDSAGCRRTYRTVERGMSPAGMNRRGKEEEGNESPTGSGYSSESSYTWQRQTPSRRRVPAQQARNTSGFAFCLSPLVRAGPNNRCRDAGFSGDIRNGNRPHLSTAASLCANRSRKLADFGRYP